MNGRPNPTPFMVAPGTVIGERPTTARVADELAGRLVRASRGTRPSSVNVERATGLPLPAPPALVTTVHDPDGRLVRFLDRNGPSLRLYGGSFASVTASTDPRLSSALNDHGVHVETSPSGAAGDGQRNALRSAIRAGYPECFVCDFDRWLHWADSHADELATLAFRLERDHPDAWYVCLGRTERALLTHPVTQILPETMTNRALSHVAGTALDATAGAAWIRLPAATLILDRSTETSKATDLEWPGLVLRADRTRLAGAFLEGTEFETPDAYATEIAASGSLETWMRATYDQPPVARDRLQLAADSVSALIRVTDRRNPETMCSSTGTAFRAANPARNADT